MEKINLLLVDDHQMVRNGLKMLLNSEKNLNVVAEASNGVEAIDFLKENYKNIDVVIMDITMPELNGIDTTEIIMKLHPNLKVLALTMHSEETYILKMLKVGARGYVLKDTDKETLVKAVNTVAEGEKYYCAEISTKLINTLIHGKEKVKTELSDREKQILALVASGKTNKEISKEVNLSARTVETHRYKITKKLKLKNTAELIKYAIKKELI